MAIIFRHFAVFVLCYLKLQMAGLLASISRSLVPNFSPSSFLQNSPSSILPSLSALFSTSPVLDRSKKKGHPRVGAMDSDGPSARAGVVMHKGKPLQEWWVETFFQYTP